MPSSKGKPTDPKLREEVKEEVKQESKGKSEPEQLSLVEMRLLEHCLSGNLADTHQVVDLVAGQLGRPASWHADTRPRAETTRTLARTRTRRRKVPQRNNPEGKKTRRRQITKRNKGNKDSISVNEVGRVNE